ncbi:MAG: lysoplasmalogenase [Thalassotalea sp.]|nr:lysoplasmalogenase [Thalassotalea sp.]
MPSVYYTGLFVVTALIYLASLSFAPYSGQHLLKVMPIIVLLIIAVRHLAPQKRLFVSLAIIASGIGDVLLVFEFESAFMIGLFSFLVAHLIYGVVFYRFANIQVEDDSFNGVLPDGQGRRRIAFGIALFAAAMGYHILPSTGDLFLPVAFYLIVITGMAISALIFNMNKLTVIGALSFVLSDSILAQSLFKTPLLASTYLVMVTYYFAQLMILLGLVKIALPESRQYEPDAEYT